uniref:Uncharacterized protein n=1 Tax=Haematococcus lacustris TaxID=44745 RepID=A0A2K9YRT3_HAELA|nr:hypothetical protein SG3EUKT975065.1 [Haematococcus lacustris]AUW36467.1 hypothetical protein SG3EUKT975065.1 [Haematococcus lacustris]
MLSKTRFNNKIIDRWNGCCGLNLICRKRLDINPIPYELHPICPKRFGGFPPLPPRRPAWKKGGRGGSSLVFPRGPLAPSWG